MISSRDASKTYIPFDIVINKCLVIPWFSCWKSCCFKSSWNHHYHEISTERAIIPVKVCVCVCVWAVSKDVKLVSYCRGVWHSCPTTRNEAVGMSGKQDLANLVYLHSDVFVFFFGFFV